MTGPITKPAPAQVELTGRQLDVLKMTAADFTTRKIAAELRISPKTVEFHRMNVRRTLKLFSDVQIVHYALKHGLVTNLYD